MEYVGLIDTSGWQFRGYHHGTIPPSSPAPDLSRAKALGVRAVIHRIGNGQTFDQSFGLVRRSALDAGLPFGAYYYVQPASDSPSQAAARVLTWLAEHPIDFKFMVDAEHFSGQENMSGPELELWLRIFARKMDTVLGNRSIFYTGAWWWNSEVGGSLLSKYDSILARYPAQNYRRPTSTWPNPPKEVPFWDDFAFSHGPTGPPLPAGETHWDGWQFTSWLQAGDYGFQTGPRMDGNIIKEDSFNRWLRECGWGLEAPAPPPVTTVPPSTNPGRVTVNVNMPVMKQGDQMDTRHVRTLQEALNKFRSPSEAIAVDGNFGPQTEQAVRNVQQAFGLTIDGWVGSQTWPPILEYPFS